MEQKKIGFWTVVFFVFGSCVGTGIFFKNNTIIANTGSLTFLIIAWLVSIFAIICLCVSIKQVAIKAKLKNEIGIYGWAKVFCNNYFYKGVRNFMLYFSIPVLMFYLPYYAIQSIMDALSVFINGVSINSWLMIVFAIILFFYFILIPIFSKKAILVQNSIFSLLKFIPLLFGIIAGLLVFFIVNQGKPQIPLIDSHLNIPSNKPFSLTTFSPYLGIIASIPAIFFSFDGFYNSSSIESRMKEPKQFPKAMILGILLVGVVYLTFSICLVLGTKNGTLVELTSHLGDPNILWVKILKFILLFLVAIAIFSVANNWGLFTIDMMKTSFEKKEILFFKKVNTKSEFKKYFLIILLLLSYFLILTFVGCFYIEDSVYEGINNYDDTSKKIFSFINLIGNWSSLFVYIGLAIIIIGYLRQYKDCGTTIKIFSYLSILFISISVVFEVINAFVTLISSILWQIQNPKTNITTYLIPNISKMLLLIVLIIICYTNKKEKNI